MCSRKINYLYKFGLSVFSLTILMAAPGFTAEKKEKTKELQPSIHACEYVASQANKGQLQSIIIKPTPDDSVDIQVPKGLSGVVLKYMMDINNDGVMERVFVESQGTAHFENFSVYKLKTDEAIEPKELWDADWSDDKERWAADRAFVEYEGATYVLGKTDQSLSYLLYINPKNEMQIVCEFGQREKPIQLLRKSHDDKVCKSAINDQLTYVEYDKLHSLSYNEIQNAGFYETTPSDKAALIDINNDGKKELVVNLQLTSGRGRGCDSNFPAVLTADRTSIDKSYEGKLPSGSCGGTKVLPFILNGKTYLDEKQTSPNADHRQVYMLDKNELKTICEFDVRPDNYVQSKLESIEKAVGGGDLWEYAISKTGATAVDILIKEGRHLNEALKEQKKLKPHSRYPISVALQHKKDDILEKLLKAGADPNLQEERGIHSNLGMAVVWGTPRSVSLLLKYGAKDKEGPLSAVSEAMRHNDLEKLEALLKGGVKISGDAALAVIRGNDKNKYQALKLMVSYGLDPNMICSAHYPTEEIIQESPGIWKIGPEVKPKRIDKTLLQWAKETGDQEVIKTLGGTGASISYAESYLLLREVNEDLNEIYKDLSNSLDKSSRQKLKDEQRKWLKERDKKCNLHGDHRLMDDWLKAVASDEQQANCVTNETKNRTMQLASRRMPFIVSPQEKTEGRSRSEWIKEYWRWAKSFPKGEEPCDDKDGSLCGQKQSGPIWFLAGSNTNGRIIRNCEAPPGSYIFIPVWLNLIEDDSNENKQCPRMKNILDNIAKNAKEIPGVVESKKEIPNFSISLITMTTGKLVLQKAIPNWADVVVEVNKKKIPRFLMKHQATDCFSLKKNGGTSQAASSGYSLILKPLPRGLYTIRFGGESVSNGFFQNIQYNLTVK
jgi:ankyrin repeat protein